MKHWVGINKASLAETTPPDYEFDYVDIGAVATGTLVTRPERMRFGSAPSRARRSIRAGDTIVSMVRTYLSATYTFRAVTEPLVCSTGFAVLTPRAATESGFVGYTCQSRGFTDWVTAASVGVAYPAVSEAKLGDYRAVVPPPDEQAGIVRFLDHMDRRVQRYIRAKQKLIKLLEEQKQAI